MKLIITQEVVDVCKTQKGGVSARTAKMLGIPYPLQSGWFRRLRGTTIEIPDDMIDVEQRKKLLDIHSGMTATPPAPVKRIQPTDFCRVCDALRGAGLDVKFDLAADELLVTSLRTGKVTKIRGCELNG